MQFFRYRNPIVSSTEVHHTELFFLSEGTENIKKKCYLFTYKRPSCCAVIHNITIEHIIQMK